MNTTENQAPINILDYGYLGDEKITISAREFMIFKAALEKGIENVTEEYLPEVLKYVNLETGDEVLEPSQEDLVSNKVLRITDKEATFSSKNVKLKYDSRKTTREMLLAMEYIHDIHFRSIEQGIAKHKSEFPKEN